MHCARHRHAASWGILAAVVTAAFSCGALPAVAQIVTVDNEDSEFTILYGDWNTGSYGNPHGSYYNWSETTEYGGDPAAAEWRPEIEEAGAYDVAIWYVQGTNRTDNATFTVHHAGGSTPVQVNQQIGGETWVPLGAFTFDAGTGGHVVLDNDAHSGVVIADAVRFTLTSSTVNLTMEVVPAGWGTTDPAPGGPYEVTTNTIVPIVAEPEPGWEFHHWAVSVGDPVAAPNSAATTVMMERSKTVTAVFVEPTPVQPEFRGFWADAFHSGYKSEAQIDEMIGEALIGNYNAIVPEVLAFHDTGGSGHGAYWDSDIVPRAGDIVGSFDPLEYLIAQAHAAGIEVHCWLVAFRVSTTWPPAGNPLVADHPEWLMVPRGNMGGGPATVDDKYTFDPGSPDVQEYLLSIVRELVTDYDIDGVHWDYIRYTSTDAGYPAYTWYDKSGLERFATITGYGGTPAIDYGPWSDFRRRGITELVRRSQVELGRVGGEPMRHSAALVTWGNAPSSFESTSSWQLFQNWRLWMEEGYLDTAIPMTYYNYNTYPSWYRNWVDQSLLWRYDRHLVTGPGIYLNSFANSVTEITYAQSAGVDGICTYSYLGTNNAGDNWWEWYDYAADNVFPEPVPTPAMSWRDPATTTEGTVYGRVTDGATGAPLDDATITLNGFAIGETDGNGFFVLTHVYAAADGTQIPLGAEYPGYDDVERPAVLIERAGYTEANLALGDWLPGDYDVDGDVDWDDYVQLAPSLTGPNNGPPPAGADLFDFDADNDVDLRDLAVFQGTFGN